jgi:ribosomal protein S27AE
MQHTLCPQCGAPVEFKSAASVMAVCGSCHSTLLKDAESVKRIGEMAEVLEDYSPIQIGSAGEYLGKRFDVIGRLQLRYDAGFWNEWYVEFENGMDGWLSDAGGQYTITRERQADGASPPLPAFDKLAAGSELQFGGKTYCASDIRRCRAVAGQGELPFAIGANGYEAVVADFRALDEFLTLDYSDSPVPKGSSARIERQVCAADRDGMQGANRSDSSSYREDLQRRRPPESADAHGAAIRAELPKVYQGKAYSLNDMQRASLRAEHLIEESAGNYAGAIKALACPSCGASISFAAAVATQVICPSCHAQVDCSGDTAQVIAKQKRVAAIKTTLALGAKANIDGEFYTLIGLLQCAEIDPGVAQAAILSHAGGSTNFQERSLWFEYLLYSPQRGFLWLVESDDGWDKVRVCDRWPARVSGARYTFNGKPYNKLYDYGSRIKVALGAFNWRAQAGDITCVTDFGAGNAKLTRESTAAEVNWSASERVEPAEIAKWFNLPELAASADKKADADSSSLQGIAIFAIIVMLFFNADALEDGRIWALLIGAAALWLPVWARSLMR